MQLTEKDILLTLAQSPRLSLKELCASITPCPEYIIDVLGLGKLNEICLEGVKTNTINMTVAYSLAKLNHAEQLLAYEAGRYMQPEAFVSLISLYLAEKKKYAKKRG